MLKINKKVTIEGETTIEDKKAMIYKAVIDSEDPENMSITAWKSDKDLYKQHRVEIRKDEAEFEEYAFSVQDEMIKALENK